MIESFATMITKKRAKSIIGHFKNKKILVIGDLILDEFIWGGVERISPEAPVPVLWANKKSYMPGGASNVASNIRSLSATAMIVGVLGPDKNRDILLSELKKRNIVTSGVIVDRRRHTTLKTRIIAGHQQVVRVDWESTENISKDINIRLINFIKKNIDKVDALIIEDYGKGLINSVLLNEVIPLAREKGKIITVDPKEEHIDLYRGVTCITPNLKEAEHALRYLKLKDTTNSFKLISEKLIDRKNIELSASELIRHLNLSSILITHGEHGMYLLEKRGTFVHIPTRAQEVFDVSGAGDTVIATFTLAKASGASYIEAAHLANYAAGIVVGKVGVACVSREELLKRID